MSCLLAASLATVTVCVLVACDQKAPCFLCLYRLQSHNRHQSCLCVTIQAQILSPTAAKPRLGHVPQSGKVPIIFFGTVEVTWSTAKDVFSWAQGLKDNLWLKNKSKNRLLFELGFEQVIQLCRPEVF